MAVVILMRASIYNSRSCKLNLMLIQGRYSDGSILRLIVKRTLITVTNIEHVDYHKEFEKP